MTPQEEIFISSIIGSAEFFVLGLGIILLIFVIIIFNGFMTLKNNIDKAWANIDVVLKKRLDLIPNLVEIVKGYAKYERGVLEEITELRASAMKAEDIPEIARNSDAISNSLKSIFFLVENYPDLKASNNFLSLQNEITRIEDQIAQRREFYNDSVLLYNTKLETIPSRFVAYPLRFRPREYFRVEKGAEKPVIIDIKNR